jgi:hypothetical protein
MKATKLVLLFAFMLVVFTGCSRSENISRIDAKKALVEFTNATIRYVEKFAKPPRDVLELMDKDLAKVKPVVLKEWEFEIYYPDEIIAYSTEENPGGPDIELRHKFSAKI